MADSALATLGQTVGAAPPADLAHLSEEQLLALATAVRNATTERTRAIDDAITDSLRYVPKLIRPAVRKLLGL